MRPDGDFDVEVALRPSVQPRLALAGKADPRSVIDARRYRQHAPDRLPDGFPTAANRARRLNRFAAPAAARTGLNLDHLAEHGIAHRFNLARPSAARTADDFRSRFRPVPMTMIAGFVAGKGDFLADPVRRFIQRVGEENIDDLFKLRLADAQSNPNTSFKPEEITLLQSRISEIRQQDMVLKVTDLKITGTDLFELGIPKGPVMGNILKELLELVIDDPSLNSREGLAKKALELYSEYSTK